MQKPFSPAPKLANRQGRRKSVISLTPLIDVVFILLVFFMLASSFLDWRSVALDTSAATESSRPADEHTSFLVQIRKDALLLNGASITLANLIEQARSRPALDQPVSLQPWQDTRVQQVIEVLDALNAAGIQPLKLLDDPAWQDEAKSVLTEPN